MSDIIVKFKPMGQKQLIDAINRLEAAQGKATTTAKKHRLAIGRNRKAMGMFEQSLATVRSRLLVFNFAMGMGIRQTIEFAKQAARVQDMSRAFTTLSGTGENAALSVNKISNAVKGTMSQMDLFKQANNAMILGVTRNTDEMAEMFQIAQTLGAALGVDTAHAVESLITGIGRQSRLMLDNIGIIVKSEEAYESYAKELGVTKDELTDSQKKQAFFTAAMESARTKAAELGNQQLTARDQFNQFNATMEDFTNFIGDKTTPVVLSFFNSFGETLKRITETDLETSIRKLEEIGISAERLADLNKILGFQEARKQIKESQKVIDKTLEELFVKKGINHVEKFGATVEKTFVDVGMDQLLPEFIIDPKDLNIDELNAELDRLKFSSETIATQLAQTDISEEYTKFLDDQILKNAELASIYNILIDALEKINEGNSLLTNTNKEVAETEENKTKKTKKTTEELEKQLKLNKELLQSSFRLGQGYKNAGDAAVAGAKAVVVAKIQEAVITYMAEAMTKIPFPLSLGVPALGAAMAAALGSVLSGSSSNVSNSVGGGATFGKFEHGGYVGGRPHSQGGTIIEAERGEFVMSRNAVESIGLETLNQMNQTGGGGNINVSVTGNVLTQDFVEGELAESIKEAVRRGSDFGIG